MKKTLGLTLGSLLIITLFGDEIYLYNKGIHDGVARYKRSQEFQLTLKSAYHFGYMDGRDGTKESWEGE